MIHKLNGKEQGLSLIELSIALTVIGFLTVAFLQLYTIQENKRLAKLQTYKQFTISDALARYQSVNGHYPCPAVKNVAVTDVNFGRSTGTGYDASGNIPIPAEAYKIVRHECNGDGAPAVGPDPAIPADPGIIARDTCSRGNVQNAAYCRVTVDDGLGNINIVRIGAVPYKDLGIGKEDVIDIHGNQFTYAVVEAQTRFAGYDLDAVQLANDGVAPAAGNEAKEAIAAITVLDRTCLPSPGPDVVNGVCRNYGDSIRRSDVVFFSHGEGGAGSNTQFGRVHHKACNNVYGTGDGENCDADATFVTNLYAVNNPGMNGTPDDDMVYDLLSWTYIWDKTPEDSTSIYNRLAGNMAVGLSAGDVIEEKLHIKSGNLRVSTDQPAVPDILNPGRMIGGLNDGGKIITSRICDENGNNCFDPEVLGSDGVVDTYDHDGNPATPEIDDPDYEEKRLACDKNGFFMKGVGDGTAKCRSILLDTSAACTQDLFYATGFTLDPVTNQISFRCRRAI